MKIPFKFLLSLAIFGKLTVTNNQFKSVYHIYKRKIP
jgi:hypothetical protein